VSRDFCAIPLLPCAFWGCRRTLKLLVTAPIYILSIRSFVCMSLTMMLTRTVEKMSLNKLRHKLAVPLLKRLDVGFPPRRPGFASGQHVGFVVNKFSPSTSVSPANHSINFSIIITRGRYSRPLVAAVPSGPNWTPPPLKFKTQVVSSRTGC
jgi:hypothetical protein